MELTGRQRRFLRSLGHHLDPVVRVGREGLTPGVAAQAERALDDHELIKIRFGTGFDGEIDAALDRLLASTSAALAGRTGRTALLYRPRVEDPEIRLP